jgi:hypothetical protein
MSAQTASAFNPMEEPVTPVIVKVGGDDDGDVNVSGTSNLVSIGIDPGSQMQFRETVPGSRWASSVSTLAGRINKVTIIDGATTISHAVTQTSELASLTIMFGPTRLIAMETGLPDKGEVFLLITSPEVTFKVDGETNGDWTGSTTTFPSKITSVALRVGDKQKLNYEFQTEKASVQIDFNLNNPN